MNRDRFITDECMDALVEWMFVNAPVALETPGLMKGIWLIVDDAIADAIAEERARHWKALNDGSPN